MYLKRLEVHGFKSFADKVVLDFHPGLSVVVGPNGSGKSNISDSIRWVIGEQSAKSLRGAKMEDIIFAGSAKRRAIGMAEVSLTLDNSTGIFPLDFAEITVTRRLYRSGESEYLINKAPCRLKDVHELFMDTGIGRDGLSIIGQGRVEEILSSKPEDRRGLIEEAAGITKYRNRKREAARKLDETEQNLVRIADIVGELEVQLEPLKDQALKAETYQGLRHELDDLELNLAVHDIADLGGKLEACRGQIAELHNKLLASETEARVLEADNAAIKLALQALDEQIYQGQSACHNLSSQIQQLESELKLCDERTASIDGQHNRLNQETEEILQKAAGLQAEYAAEEAKVLILQQTRKELEAALQDKETRVTNFEKELGSAETRIEGLKDEIFELMSRNANLNNELTAATQKGEGYASRRNNLNEVVASRETELAEAKAGLENLQAELGITRDGINGNLFRAGELKTEREGLEQRKTELQREAGRLNEQLQHATSRLKVLLDMQRDFEGYNRGVKEVLQAARDSKLRGIAGVVAELIQVPAHLETAVEVALGGSLQNVVSFLESDAKQAISFLKQNRFGRATFLPLDVLQPSPRSFDAKVLSAPGVLGVAADLVNYDRQFKPVAEYLLGRILVVENLERATQVAKLGGYKLRIVTVDGELLSPGGSLTGGSLQQRSSNLLGRNREIAQLEEGVKSSREKLEGLRREEQGFINRIEEIEQGRLQILATVKDLELKLVSLESERANLAREQTRLGQEISQFQLETGQIEAELSRLSSVQEELRREQQQVQAESDRANRDLGLAQEEIKGQGSARAELLVEITELRVNIASLEQQEMGLQTALERYYQQKAEFQTTISQRKQERAQLETRKQEIAAEVSRLRENLGNLINAERTGQSGLQDLREERQQKLTGLADKENVEKALRRQVQELQETLHSSQLREARLDTEISSAVNRLQENLGLSLEEAQPRSTPLANRREAVIKLNKIKSEIHGLGPVNLGAIEEYTRVSERFEFLTTQRADLIQAKDSLFSVIAEMDRIMVERFGKSFALIKERFAQVFVEMFGGGKAELQLTDPENLLETGIDIIVQPPGKKLQHLSLLSGGEKALTAIALLFAMLQVKPSPFCVLDEIEAALDEANVNRFADYLRDLSGQNQFIVISHRKGTMEAANVLYGVTMEETGVSKLYSVRMAEFEPRESLVGK